MRGYIQSLILESASHQAQMDLKCDEEIAAAKKMYWDACKYPRKQKKAMRKVAQQEYSFWMGMKNFPSIFNF